MTTVIKDVVTWLKQWFYTESEVDTITGGLQTQINNKADSSTVSALATTVSGKADSTHTHGNLQSDGKVGTSNNASKNVVTDANGKITTEAKPSIPSASSTTPSADVSGGAVGTGTSWARADHQHPFPSQLATSTISANTDLDTLTTDGIYIADASVVSSLTNAPFSSANDGFVMEVRNGSDGSIQQTVYLTDNTTEGTCDYYIRNYINSDWIDWYEVPIKRLLDGNVFNFLSTSSTSTSSAYVVNDYSTIKSLKQGTTVYILNTKADNSANATLKVSNFDAKPIYTNNTAIASGEWKKNSVNLFVYTTFASFNSGNGAWIMFENMYNHPTSHATSMITEASALANIGTSANASQHDINDAINTTIGTLQSINAIEVVDTKPTASASTMGKLYIVSESNKVNVYYTKRTGTSPNYTYTWQKMDTDILDELSISWNDVTNKPTNILNSTITLVDAGETNEGCIIFNTL